MKLTQETRNDSLVVKVGGVIDHEYAPAFEEKLQPLMKSAADNDMALIIDMENVEYMSTVGLRVLMRASKRARETSVDVRVANMSDVMREIFKISRFDKVIPMFDSIDAAMAN